MIDYYRFSHIINEFVFFPEIQLNLSMYRSVLDEKWDICIIS